MSAQRPQDLVFTLFGEYLLDRAPAVWVGSLIALLEPFGLSSGGVRTVLSRMARKGWLGSERRGRYSYYVLTPRGRRLLEEGQARIYHPHWDAEWSGRWLLLAYSIPQDARKLRDRLRDRLAWLGFGSIGNGLWISPHNVTEEIEALSETLDLREHLVCFLAERVGDMGDRDLVERCWDLAALNEEYRAFVDRWRPIAVDFERSAPEDSKQSFALRFELIHEFRRFPLDDPYLPRPLLPDDWNGDEATELFRSLHDRLRGPADAWVDGVLEAEPGRTGR